MELKETIRVIEKLIYKTANAMPRERKQAEKTPKEVANALPPRNLRTPKSYNHDRCQSRCTAAQGVWVHVLDPSTGRAPFKISISKVICRSRPQNAEDIGSPSCRIPADDVDPFPAFPSQYPVGQNRSNNRIKKIQNNSNVHATAPDFVADPNIVASKRIVEAIMAYSRRV